MEAQRIITISINKIAGSRNQRGGINLRKNLLVASVLQSARTLYYEEMCNKMSRTTTLYCRQDSDSDIMESDSSSDEDCTEAPDWGDEPTNNNNNMPSACEQQNVAGNTPVLECTSMSISPVVPCPANNEDKENRLPDHIVPVVDTLEPVKCERIEQVEDLKSCEESEERPVLRDLSSQNYSCVNCKRKRVEEEPSYDYVSIKRAKMDSDCCYTQQLSSDNAPIPMQTEPITSLVSIFKSGFHGLSGDSLRNSNAGSPTSQSTSEQQQNRSSVMSSHLEPSPYVSPIARSLDILSRPIAAC